MKTGKEMVDTHCSINIKNGKLNIGDWYFPENSNSSEANIQSDDSYSSIEKEIKFKGNPLKIYASYKNQSLRSITINIDQVYLNKKYEVEVFEKNIANYVKFCKSSCEELINKITKQRNFNWGKITINVDPRDPFVFIEIKYIGKPKF